jgi:hypothetical protein
MEVYTSKALRISLKENLFIEDKLRKFVEQQLRKKYKKIMSLEKQLKEKKATRNQVEKEQEELGTHCMQTNTKLEVFKTNFIDCQEMVNMSSRTQVELKSLN